MRYVQITLIAEHDGRNAYGDLTKTETRRNVMAAEASVGMTEVYQGMAVGFKPEVKFKLSNWLDYEGEERIEYTPFGATDPIKLRVLRTYNAGDALEITCYRDNEGKPDPEPEEPEVIDNANTEEPNEDDS